MVRVIGRVEFVCPYCDASYEDRSEAENCAQLCAPVDDVVRKELDDLFVCEMCDVKWDSRDEAMKCEREHVERSDKHYDAFVYRREREKLSVASKLPGQKKLVDEKCPHGFSKEVCEKSCLGALFG